MGREWVFIDVAVGQKVCMYVRDPWRGGAIWDFQVSEVTRVTPTQVTAFGGRRFRRASGHEIGVCFARLRVWTPEIEARAAADDAVRKDAAKLHLLVQWMRQLPHEEAAKVWALIPEELQQHAKEST